MGYDKPMTTKKSSETSIKKNSINRKKIVPFLVRLFPNIGPHRRDDEYIFKNLPRNELQIYSWMDTTLREIAEFIKQIISESRVNRRISFCCINIIRPKPIFKSIGVVHTIARRQDDNITLRDIKFEIVEFIDVSII